MTNPEGLSIGYELEPEEFVREDRIENFKKLERYAKMLLNLTTDEANVSNSQQRIEMIKSWSGDDFLNICSIANNILIGNSREKWQGKVPETYIGESEGEKDFENFSTADTELKKFFESMRSELNAENIDLYAFKLYLAIVNAHIFSDGNGRLARIAYNFVKKGSFDLSQMSYNSSARAKGLCRSIYTGAVISILQNLIPDATYEDLQVRRGGEKNELGSFFEGKKIESPSMVNVLRYIAAVRAGLGTVAQNEIWGESWTEDEKKRFRAEYLKVKEDCFWKCNEVANSVPKEAIDSVFEKQKREDE